MNRLRGRRRRLTALSVAVGLFLASGCGLPLLNQSGTPDGWVHPDSTGLRAETRYAAEVLAYMMRVVLGHAGDLPRRDDWRRQGLGQPLDLEKIRAAMDHPQRPKEDLLVVDAGLIGLSEVLYDYDPRLNLFKGQYAFHSPYPSAELIALRLLLLGKLARGETLSLGAIERNEVGLLSEAAVLPPEALRAMGLQIEEAALLRAVFRSEPSFRWYYKSPPLVAAMDAMGLLAGESLVSRRAAAFDYGDWRTPSQVAGSAVRLAVLPSLVPGFRMAAGGEWVPPQDYVQTVTAFKRDLEKAVAARRDMAAGPVTEPLVIDLYLERPFVLEPSTAQRHLTRLCPDADLVVIVLGRNVYRAIAFEPVAAATAPPEPWYLDILDLKYGQVTAEIEAIADAAVRRMTPSRAAQHQPATSEALSAEDADDEEKSV